MLPNQKQTEMLKKRLEERLKDNETAYETNFNKMWEAGQSGDKENHRKYIKEERRLNKINVELRKALGMMAGDPCPQVKIACSACEQKNGGCNLLKKLFKEPKDEIEERQ